MELSKVEVLEISFGQEVRVVRQSHRKIAAFQARLDLRDDFRNAFLRELAGHGIGKLMAIREMRKRDQPATWERTEERAPGVAVGAVCLVSAVALEIPETRSAQVKREILRA